MELGYEKKSQMNCVFYKMCKDPHLVYQLRQYSSGSKIVVTFLSHSVIIQAFTPVSN